MIKLCGFADEASQPIEGQVKATKELGWQYISLRAVNGVNVHELPEREFDAVASAVEDAGIGVVEFGSAIGNWAKEPESPLDISMAEVERCIPRMRRLGCSLVRVMSFKQKPWGEDQLEEERFRKLRAIVERFAEAGITAAHENCMNYGGFSPGHTLRLLEEVPDLKLVFDTGNPVFARDRSKPEPQPWQNAWEFYSTVKDRVIHVHIKDGYMPEGAEKAVFTTAGEGDGHVREVVGDLIASGYDGAIAIEPHVATVFHDEPKKTDWDECYRKYVEYGKNFEALVKELQEAFASGKP